MQTKPVTVPSPTIPVKEQNKQSESTKTANRVLGSVINDKQAVNKPKKGSLQAKVAKFQRDPYNFFNDSKNPIFKMGRVFFEKD